MVTANDEKVSAALLGGREVRALAESLGIRPTKRMGQNFVTDPNTVRRIAAAARLTDDDIVLEVGPGLGSLTLALLPYARTVVAVELDPVLAEQLPVTVRERLPEFAERLITVHEDAMRITELPVAPTALVANLPYNVAVPVVLNLLERFPSLESVLVMVQKEVADRLAAGPGSRTYGVPSVKARWYCSVEAAGNVGTSVFWPVPHVDSGLVRMTRHASPPSRAGREATFAVIDAAFAQRRKTLRSALASLAGSAPAAEAALRNAGVDPGLRGEQLGVGEFARIADALAEASGPSSQ
ncbi:MAG: 16S rRNA (adenine(1518)-N(6)/adenine(1519)-N(6))-dimethyltransferase RsmA [Candidatus Nanopelagicales bacterium]|nr:16S rRNA (adenine(1518)-N(6)/adenine(1519)-N(6))-dimethyltransferase RsmA [Candidatus Nanopelagicales bacterium]MCF8538633.1 16S rRNA (adenine(1518)-N(6)/adenine(1519)-N(6))-dimethyltransferase RsmA [Candidatus Nanopelagicales bacterium]